MGIDRPAYVRDTGARSPGQRNPFIDLLLSVALLLIVLGAPPLRAGVSVTTVDLLAKAGYQVNGVGPMLVKMDGERDWVVVANTLSSSLTFIDGKTDRVQSVPVGRRGLQHLKADALAIRSKTGEVALVGHKSLMIVDPTSGTSQTLLTEAQLESVAFDELTGNIFLCGRERREMSFVEAGGGIIRRLPWLEHQEELVNLNQTPPPPIRRVVAVPSAGQGSPGRMAALDGFTASLYLFDGATGRLLSSRDLPLTAGGRWHLAGVNHKTGFLYLVVETDERKVIEAARIDTRGENDLVVTLPELTEGVGMAYSPKREEVYIAYDNQPTVHVVAFQEGSLLAEIELPAYGNDAAVLDEVRGRLYVASWAFGEIEVVDLETRRLVKKIEGLGIIPHMFTMTLRPESGHLYFPLGATAVNGTFGAAVTRLDPVTGETVKIRTGLAPVDLVELPERSSFLVFSNEDQMTEVTTTGVVQEIRDLPVDFPLQATRGPGDEVYLSYGPHQSYWPVVYIWGARNGLLSLDSENLATYDRRLPRQALDMALDPASGVLYLPQNSWGREKQFLTLVEGGIRYPDVRNRLELDDEAERETIQRILKLDPVDRVLYLLRVGEKDADPSVLQVIDPRKKEVTNRLEVGLNATDLLFDDERILTANFGSDSVSVISKKDWTIQEISAPGAPLRLVRLGDRVFVLRHRDRILQEIGVGRGKSWKIPAAGRPDGLFAWRQKLVITAHSAGQLFVLLFDPEEEAFETAFVGAYPFGETRFDTTNSSFYLSGQFGDAVFHLTRGRVAADGRLWLADFLSGKVLVLEAQ